MTRGRKSLRTASNLRSRKSPEMKDLVKELGWMQQDRGCQRSSGPAWRSGTETKTSGRPSTKELADGTQKRDALNIGAGWIL